MFGCLFVAHVMQSDVVLPPMSPIMTIRFILVISLRNIMLSEINPRAIRSLSVDPAFCECILSTITVPAGVIHKQDSEQL